LCPLSRAEVREIDRRAIEEYGMSGLVLMENAGRGCVEVLLSLGCRGPVTIVCGKGNNAGDGFVIARHLDLAGVNVKVILLSPAARRRSGQRSGLRQWGAVRTHELRRSHLHIRGPKNRLFRCDSSRVSGSSSRHRYRRAAAAARNLSGLSRTASINGAGHKYEQ